MNILDKSDSLAAFEGRKGGVLEAYSSSDGKKLYSCKLKSPPCFDGLIAAGGRLFMTTEDGKLVCFSSGN